MSVSKPSSDQSMFALTRTMFLSPPWFAQFKTGGEGEALQRSLLEYSADKDSFVEEFWDDSYLTPKSSVVLNLK